MTQKGMFFVVLWYVVGQISTMTFTAADILRLTLLYILRIYNVLMGPQLEEGKRKIMRKIYVIYKYALQL